MGAKHLVIVMLTALLCGCASVRQATLYPVRGPIFDSGKVQPFGATFTDFYSGIGKCSATLPGGQICTGEWSMAGSTLTTSSSLVLGDAWGTLYGEGFGVTTGGQQPGMATLICPDGNVLQLQFLTGGDVGHGIGVGTDSQGNAFRMHF